MSSTSSLEKLPAETLQTIMIELADASALPSLLQSSPILYQTFKSSEATIVNKLLIKQFGPDMLTHALAAFRSFTLNPQNTQDIKSFTDNYYTKNPSIPRIKNLFEAINISKGHLYIQHFTSKFITTALSKQGQTRYNTTPIPYALSSTEITRIERSFYIFETYCNLFRSNENLDVPSFLSDEEQHDLIFSKFAPWEANQIGCIYTFLQTEIKPAYNDIKTHDIEFAGISATRGRSPLITTSQLLSRGLASIYEITQTLTYSSRYAAIFPPSNPSRHFPNNNLLNVLSCRLDRPHTRHINPLELDITSSLFPDEDCGPSEAWLRENENYDVRDNGLTLGGGSESMREWGYVFWTYSRLSSWNFFTPAQIPPPQQLPLSPHSLADFQMQMMLLEQQSRRRCGYARRTDPGYSRKVLLFQAGGRGWWSKDDESRVLWPVGRPSPLDDKKARKACEKCNKLNEGRQKGKRKAVCVAHGLVLAMPKEKEGGEEV
ncbi:hypothetical protein B0J14DRAFT_49773 [Halenospora varia]|nr:hypothetical protein B0J14DRAFT_49773 [Halenospora varia]